ncbi:hypothetical protein G7007_18380 [Pseudomonas entomophila]|uniref:hypothetical protein n=1 Tax=Pseudomonas entomophila TaxID=312306 RepID=UPI0015E39C41|nr:hypothetical protein [Pseudomonas entomophila]MBA1194802.1 hypothetical protein [Pseudomonas entomophila]
MIIHLLTDFLHSLWGLAFVAAPFVFIVVALGMDVHIVLSGDFNIMLRALARSPALSSFQGVWRGNSLRSKVMLISMVSALFIWPKYFIERGWLDVQDHDSFPVGLRRKILISAWLNTIGCVWLVLAGGAVKITRL